MTTISLITKINAPKKIVFNLARNIDVHQNSASQTHEKAIDGVVSGEINFNETVTWRGKHFGFYLKHTSLITAMTPFDFFEDAMLKGHFKSFVHEHTFVEQNGKTAMIDCLNYDVPFGIFGKLFDRWFLKKHLIAFLEHRNNVIKNLAEKL
jgi:ligand-binding SRPBCC domain-containing protein